MPGKSSNQTLLLNQLLKTQQKNEDCCIDFLTQVVTENTATVTFSGAGTAASPLMAIASGSGPSIGATNGLNLTAGNIGLGGTLTQATTINTSASNFAFALTGTKAGNPTTFTLSMGAASFMTYNGGDPTALCGISITHPHAGAGAGASFNLFNDVSHVGGNRTTSTLYASAGVPPDAYTIFTNTATGIYFSSFGGGGFSWSNAQSSTGTYMVLNNAGNLIIGVTGTLTPTDTGAKLQVNGSINLHTITPPVTPVNGNLETDGTNLYFTVGGVRKTVTLT